MERHRTCFVGSQLTREFCNLIAISHWRNKSCYGTLAEVAGSTTRHIRFILILYYLIMASEKIVIGTRGSKLALLQAEIVRQSLATTSNATIEIKIVKTEGDSNFSPIPLDTVGKGWFTKEIEKELSKGGIDIATHSLKDLPEQLPAGLCISAYLDRADPRDVLVSNGGVELKELKAGAVVGTDSLRRKVQLLALRPDLRVESIRGNVLTRIKKLDTGDYDAIVIAAAGLLRLGLQERITQYFSVLEITPAPGQGILAIETRIDDTKTNELVKNTEDQLARDVALAERSFSAALGGGCKTPLGAHTTIDDSVLSLDGMVADDSGRIARAQVSGARDKAVLLGAELAGKLQQGV